MGWLSSILSALSLFKWLWETARSVIGWISDFITRRKQKQKLEEMEKAEAALETANQIENDEERLKAKAEAACALEKAVNPDADCGG